MRLPCLKTAYRAWPRGSARAAGYACRAAALLCCGWLLLPGCIVEEKKRPLPPSRSVSGVVEEIHLLSSPVTANLDGLPGVDGFGIKLYASGTGQTQSVTIGSGTMEIIMFDGLAESITEETPPLRTWKFSSQDLKNFEVPTAVGTGYQLVLAWEKAKPKQERITVLARYTSEKGRRIYSAPTSIVMGR